MCIKHCHPYAHQNIDALILKGTLQSFPALPIRSTIFNGYPIPASLGYPWSQKFNEKSIQSALDDTPIAEQLVAHLANTACFQLNICEGRFRATRKEEKKRAEAIHDSIAKQRFVRTMLPFDLF